MKDFSFWVFNYETEFWKKIRDDIVTIKKQGIWKWEKFALSDKETIVYKG